MVSHSRPLLIVAAFGVFAFPGCFSDIWEQAQNAAVRKQTFNELKQYSQAWFAHHDTHNRGPKNWQELGQFAPAGLQQTLEGKGYQFVWGASIREMKVGTSNTIMAYPSDAATSGGLVSMADGSVQFFTAEELNQKFAAQDVGNKGTNPSAAAANSAASSPTGNHAPPGPPAPAISGAAAASTSPVASSPVSSAPNVSPPAGGPAQTFSRGQTAYVEYAGKWEPVEILEVLAGNQYKIRWSNWGSQWDEVRGGDRLATSVPAGGIVAEKRASAPSRTTSFEPSPPGGGEAPGSALADGSVVTAGDKVHAFWFGKWIDGEVVETSSGHLIKVRVPGPVRGAPPQEIPLPRHWVRSMGAVPSKSATAGSSPARSAPAAAPAAQRTWTDSSGKFKIEAKFISLAGGHVTLEKPDGMQIRMPLDKLSAADQKFVTEQALRP